MNRPGAAAREQAVALRREAPVRTLLARAMRVHTDERAWRIGADGEEAVAARLARLGPSGVSCTRSRLVSETLTSTTWPSALRASSPSTPRSTQTRMCGWQVTTSGSTVAACPTSGTLASKPPGPRARDRRGAPHARASGRWTPRAARRLVRKGKYEHAGGEAVCDGPLHHSTRGEMCPRSREAEEAGPGAVGVSPGQSVGTCRPWRLALRS